MGGIKTNNCKYLCKRFIVCCLRSSEQYFSYIHDENKITNDTSCMQKDGTGMNIQADFFPSGRT
jgi:hypothetical protein